MEWANQIPRPIQSPLRLSLNLYLAADIFLLEYQMQITQIYRICTTVVTQFLLIFFILFHVVSLYYLISYLNKVFRNTPVLSERVSEATCTVAM
jgi:hypothetical protein